MKPRDLHRSALACASVVLICGTVGACSSSRASEAGGVEKAQIVKTLNEAAQTTLGKPFEHIDCDRGLEAKIGDQARCVAEAAGVRGPSTSRSPQSKTGT